MSLPLNEPPVTHSSPNGARHDPPVRELTQDELVKLPMQALLVRLGRLSLEQLAEALRENVASGTPVEDIAVARGWVQAAEVEHLRSTKRALGAPVDEPAPPADTTAAPETGEEAAAVFLALQGGGRVRVGPFTSMEACRKRADEIMDLFNRPEPGVWPRFGNRLVRPEAVAAIEISRRRDD